MPTTTTRLGLTNPALTDTPSELRLGATATNAVLDNAPIYQESTLAGRPTATGQTHGYFWRTTDSQSETFAWSNGTSWVPVGLALASTSVDTTVQSGQFLKVTGSSLRTISLPTGAAAGRSTMVGVANYSSGGTVISGSLNMSGPGMATGVSSLSLGTLGAYVIMIQEGVIWYVMSGQQDSGQTALTLTLNVITQSGNFYTPAARLVGDVVQLSGSMQNNTGGTLTNAQWATIPSFAFPAHTAPLAQGIITVGVTGTLFVAGAQGNGATVPLDGLSYRLL